MSYCVNCGVELDPSLKRCPLCNTPVIHPSQLAQKDTQARSFYPSRKGQVDTVKRTDIAILISVILVGTAIACGLLNLFVYRQNHWSFYVIGACILLWIFFTPMLIYSRLNIYLTILFDAAAVAAYIGIVAYEFPKAVWYTHVVLPLVVITAGLVMLYAFLRRRFSPSVLASALILILELAVFCISIELLTRYYLEKRLYISWSAVVLTYCAVIAAALFTIITRVRLREEIRRRMHI